jgi:hypothetical protein
MGGRQSPWGISGGQQTPFGAGRMGGGVGFGGPVRSEPTIARPFKKGGKIKGKKGKHVKIKAEAGERVLTAKQNKKWEASRKRKKSDSNAYVAGRRA